MNWIIENRQWLFDGIGAALLVTFIGWLANRLFGRSDSGGQRQQGGANSVNVQAGRDASVGDIHQKGQ